MYIYESVLIEKTGQQNTNFPPNLHTIASFWLLNMNNNLNEQLLGGFGAKHINVSRFSLFILENPFCWFLLDFRFEPIEKDVIVDFIDFSPQSDRKSSLNISQRLII